MFYPYHCGIGVLAADLLPRATALVWSSDTTDTVAFVSHFLKSPVGQPRAVYLSRYKAASQRAKGKEIGTEVGVKGTECHYVLQQSSDCKCLGHS